MGEAKTKRAVRRSGSISTKGGCASGVREARTVGPRPARRSAKIGRRSMRALFATPVKGVNILRL